MRRATRAAGATLLVAVLTAGLGACGDDDDGGDEASTADEGSSGSAGSSGSGDLDAAGTASASFCEGFTALDQAFAQAPEDPAEMEPFLTGLVENNTYLGRPADVMVMKDGSLLVSDDHNGAIYRVSYGK